MLDSDDDDNDDTPADSLVGMRKQLKKANATANASLECSVKTYGMVKTLVDNMRRAQNDARWAMLCAALAVFASFVGLACR